MFKTPNIIYFDFQMVRFSLHLLDLEDIIKLIHTLEKFEENSPLSDAVFEALHYQAQYLQKNILND